MKLLIKIIKIVIGIIVVSTIMIVGWKWAEYNDNHSPQFIIYNR